MIANINIIKICALLTFVVSSCTLIFCKDDSCEIVLILSDSRGALLFQWQPKKYKGGWVLPVNPAEHHTWQSSKPS